MAFFDLRLLPSLCFVASFSNPRSSVWCRNGARLQRGDHSLSCTHVHCVGLLVVSSRSLLVSVSSSIKLQFSWMLLSIVDYFQTYSHLWSSDCCIASNHSARICCDFVAPSQNRLAHSRAQPHYRFLAHPLDVRVDALNECVDR